MKKILLTGAAGYIGSHTLLELAKLNEYELYVFDNLKNGHKKAVEIIENHTNKKIELTQGELLDFDKISQTVSRVRPDAVIHFAALIEAGKSVINPTSFYINNVSGSLNLIKAMQQNGVQRLVFSSTAAVYGTPKEAEVNENTQLNPDNPYGMSKLVVENILRDLDKPNTAEEEKIKSIILRYFNAAGANPDLLIGQDYPKPTHLITSAIEAALGLRQGFQIFGNDYPTPDGTCIRDYIHVEDLAKAHVKALNYLLQNNKSDLFNIGTGKGYSNLEILKLIEKVHGKFDWSFGPRRAGDPVAFYANNEKAKAVLGWEPMFGITETVKHAYNWKIKYPNGYDDK